MKRNLIILCFQSFLWMLLIINNYFHYFDTLQTYELKKDQYICIYIYGMIVLIYIRNLRLLKAT